MSVKEVGSDSKRSTVEEIEWNIFAYDFALSVLEDETMTNNQKIKIVKEGIRELELLKKMKGMVFVWRK